MLLERFDIGEMKGAAQGGRPLVVTKENARKAFFYKVNRHGYQQKRGGTRLSRRAGFLRGNSFAGVRFGQRVVVKINPVKNRTKGVGVGR